MRRIVSTKTSPPVPGTRCVPLPARGSDLAVAMGLSADSGRRRSWRSGCRRPVDAPQPALTPVQRDFPRAEPTTRAQVAAAHHVVQRHRVALGQFDHLAAVTELVDEARDSLSYAVRTAAVRRHFA